VLAGDQAVWATDRRRVGFDLWSAAPGRSAKKLGSYPDPPEVGIDLAASAGRIAAAVTVFDNRGNAYAQDLRSAPVGGTLTSVDEGCLLSPFVRIADLDGDVIAYQRCTAGGIEAVTRDLAAQRSEAVPLPGNSHGALRVAGNFVVAVDGTTQERYTLSSISVYDRLSGALAYRLPVEAVERGVHSLALQDDGTLVFSFAASGVPAGERVAWASPSEPVAHVLPLPRRDKYEVAIADSKIGYLASRSNANGYILGGTVGVTDLAGNTRIIAHGAAGSYFNENFDFDGTRVAWWSYGCTRALVHVRDVADGPSTGTGRSRCRLRFTGPLRIKRGDRVTFPVDCFGFLDHSCDADRVRITASVEGRRVVVARSALEGGISLTRRGRNARRSRHRLPVRVSAVLSDGTAHRERRTGRATLAFQSS
jgi:hypothetical protein